MKHPYDAVLLVSFGGPERPDHVIPFLENVVRGKNVPRARLLEVAKRYDLFGGASPINAQNRALLEALIAELSTHGPQLPVYWGNRNWHPLLPHTLQQMAHDGIRRALGFVTSAFGSYPTCRQYLEDLEHARQAVAEDAPQVDKLRLFYNHPGFIEPMAERAAAALQQVPPERRQRARIIFTAHSIPAAMAQMSPYQRQLHEACRLVSEHLESGQDTVSGGSRSARSENGAARLPRGQTVSQPQPESPQWELAYQSRSGPPSEPWLGPDLSDSLTRLAENDEVHDVVIVPIGFLCEHMETVYDLDVEAADLCGRLRLNMVRAAAIGTHPRFVTMIRELIQERIEDEPTRLALGTHGPSPDVCPPDCCAPGESSLPVPPHTGRQL